MKRIASIFFIVSIIFGTEINIGDLNTFFVEKLNLSTEEARLTSEELYAKGLKLYSQSGEPQKKTLSDGTVIKYNSSINKKDSMRYFIASCLLGKKEACFIGIKYLTTDAFFPGALQYRYLMAKKLHDMGILYGTYILSLTNKYGRGISKNHSKAVYYASIVEEYCKNSPEFAYELLNDNPSASSTQIRIKGKMRCDIARKTADTLLENSPQLTKENKEKIIKLRKKIKELLLNKQEHSIKQEVLEK